MAAAGRSEARLAAELSPSVGVVIPTLDEALTLPRLLDRLLDRAAWPDARDRPDEIIVVDGGSRDESVAIARERGVRVVSAPRGRGTQLRAGAACARADVIVVLHADTRPESGAIAAVRAAFADPNVAWAAMRQRIERGGWFYRCVERAANQRSRWGWVWGDSGLSVRRSVYEAVGGFRDLEVFEDVDLSRRLRRRAPVRMLRDASLAIGARRWVKEGALRATLRNWILTAGFFLGLDPKKLARHYRPHGAPPL